MKTINTVDPKNRLVYSVSELAGVLNVGLPTAQNLVHVKGFPKLKIGGRYLIPKQALEDWLKQQTEKEVG